MSQPPTPPTPVLDYDPLTRRHAVSRVWRRVLFILICGIAGAIVGLLFAPGDFRAVVLVSAAPSTNQQAMQAVRSPTALAGGVSSAKINGATFTPAQVLGKLEVRALRASQVIEVAATDGDPGVAAAIVAGVTKSYAASDPSARILTGPGIPTRQVLRTPILAVGIGMGLLFGWVVVTLRRR